VRVEGGEKMKKLKILALILLGITYLMPWYRASDGMLVGGHAVNGWMIPEAEGLGILNILYLTPLFIIISLVLLFMGKESRIILFLTGLPITVFWILVTLAGVGDGLWTFAFFTGKWALYLSVIIMILSFVSGKEKVNVSQAS